MAFQKGIIKIKGTMGDITFAQTKRGFTARENNAVSGARIKSDPKFARTRENNAEFGRACKDAKMLRKALRTLVNRSKDADMSIRLTGQMIKVIKADPKSVRGERNTMDGNTKLLKDFDFNIKAPLDRTFTAPFTATINRVTGETLVDVPAFNPKQFIVAPPGATHCRIVTAGSLVDFDGQVYSTGTARGPAIDLSGIQPASFHDSNLVTPNGKAPIFILLGVEFYESMNGGEYPILNGAFNTLSIVAVDGGPRSAQLKIEGLAALAAEPESSTEDQPS